MISRRETSMQLLATKELYTYWESIRAGRPSPERNDIDPGAIRSVLADTFILDFDNQNGFPFRIAGSKTNAMFLTELRGVSFLKLWREADHEEIKSILRRLGSEIQPFCLGAEARPPGLSRLEIEAMLLPLRHQGSTRSRVLGSIAARSTPHWLSLISVGLMTLTSARVLDPSGSPAASEHAKGASLAAAALSARDSISHQPPIKQKR